MRGRRQQSPLSLFAFQDIITGVTGVVVLLTLILAVELLRRPPASSPSSEQASQALIVERDRLRDQNAQLRKSLQETNNLLERAANLPVSALGSDEAELESRASALEAEVEDLDAQLDATRREAKEVLAKEQEVKQSLQLDQLRESVQLLEERLRREEQVRRIVYNPNPAQNNSPILLDLRPESIQVYRLGATEPTQQFRDPQLQRRVAACIAWARGHNPTREYFVLLLRPGAMPVYRELTSRLEDIGFQLGVDLLGPNSLLAGLIDSGEGDTP